MSHGPALRNPHSRPSSFCKSPSQSAGAAMTTTRLFGIVFLMVGTVLLYMGVSASQSFADQFKHSFTGRFTDTTTCYILGGLACETVGLLLFLFGARRRRRRA